MFREDNALYSKQVENGLFYGCFLPIVDDPAKLAFAEDHNVSDFLKEMFFGFFVFKRECEQVFVCFFTEFEGVVSQECFSVLSNEAFVQQ